MTKSRLPQIKIILLVGVVGTALLFAGALRPLLAPFVVLWSWTAQVHQAVVGLWLLAKDRWDQEQDLHNTREALDLERTAYDTLQKEINHLHSLLGRQGELDGVLAGVIAAPPAAVYDTLIIDAGSQEGVRVGMVALSQKEMWPLGVVDVVEPYLARVRLYSFPETQIQAFVGEHQTPILLAGRGGGVLEGTLPRELSPPVGAVVWASGVSTVPIGKVVRVVTTPANPQAAVIVRLVPNPFTVRRVILTDKVRLLPQEWWERLTTAPSQSGTLNTDATQNAASAASSTEGALNTLEAAEGTMQADPESAIDR
ncbi:MAG: hypothetical protein KatS3mg100_474 [Candidatus Parcubacteria bacterium]|nr:MAG: hypothetical protein KatS3mg100_474 [Candidatus Parcubacteria bacterium]